MKKAVAMVLVVMVVLAFGASAFAAGQGLSLEQAKQEAVNYAGVRMEEVTFTKAYQGWDDGRAVYEIEFYANGTEYDMDVDVLTGRITDFSREYHGGYDAGQFGGYYGYYDDRDWDDAFDDLFDWFD
ncbi:MAG: PepSY domain-containing protein [Oscillospiraceae bacterium]|nr:PepSY domain-containing protein [Oscillospiraceae bacterium]